MFIRNPDVFVWPNHFKKKISCKCIFNSAMVEAVDKEIDRDMDMDMDMETWTQTLTWTGTWT
jgi:hypothetical protein